MRDKDRIREMKVLHKYISIGFKNEMRYIYKIERDSTRMK